MIFKFASVLFFSLFIVNSASAIVNLDNLHLGEKESGFNGDVSLGVSGESGHSERFQAKSAANAQWNLQNLQYYLSFNYAYGESAGIEDQNKGFLHARRIKNISDRLAWEVFSQVEHNKFARLNFRGLLGGGTRYGPVNKNKKHTTFLGAGGFFSREDLTNSSVTTDNGVDDIWRANIYLLERISFENDVSLFETLYFQPSLSAPDDFRVLNILGVKTKLSKQFSLSFSLEVTHDSEPPQGVVKTDSNYFTNIEYSF